MVNAMNKNFLVLMLALGVFQSSAWAACVGNNKPDVIYQDNQDGTITDLKTNLTWQKCSVGLSGAACTTGTATQFTWLTASQHVLSVNDDDGTDWRLPSVAELRTLIDDACYDAAINPNYFPATETTIRYWTSTPYFADSSVQNDAKKAWYIDFAQGLENSADKDQSYVIRLVKGSNP